MRYIDHVLTISLGCSLAKIQSRGIVQYCLWQFVSSLGMGSLARAYVSADCGFADHLPTPTSDSQDH